MRWWRSAACVQRVRPRVRGVSCIRRQAGGDVPQTCQSQLATSHPAVHHLPHAPPCPCAASTGPTGLQPPLPPSTPAALHICRPPPRSSTPPPPHRSTTTSRHPPIHPSAHPSSRRHPPTPQTHLDCVHAVAAEVERRPQHQRVAGAVLEALKARHARLRGGDDKGEAGGPGVQGGGRGEERQVSRRGSGRT